MTTSTDDKENREDSVRGVLQILRNKPGATFNDVRVHCSMRGDDLSTWPTWIAGAEGYVTEAAAARMIYEIMQNQFPRPPIEERGACHDAAERDEGCFRALKAERELAEAKQDLLAAIDRANILEAQLSAREPTFEQVRNAIVKRMKGHTTDLRSSAAWGTFLNLLKLVEREECDLTRRTETDALAKFVAAQQSPGDDLTRAAQEALRAEEAPPQDAKDAARYRWLRAHSWVDTSLIHSVLNFGPGYQQTKPEILDAAIDALLNGPEGKHK